MPVMLPPGQGTTITLPPGQSPPQQPRDVGPPSPFKQAHGPDLVILPHQDAGQGQPGTQQQMSMGRYGQPARLSVSGFLQAIHGNPHDKSHGLIFADYLDEIGRGKLAALYRHPDHPGTPVGGLIGNVRSRPSWIHLASALREFGKPQLARSLAYIGLRGKPYGARGSGYEQLASHDTLEVPQSLVFGSSLTGPASPAIHDAHVSVGGVPIQIYSTRQHGGWEGTGDYVLSVHHPDSRRIGEQSRAGERYSHPPIGSIYVKPAIAKHIIHHEADAHISPTLGMDKREWVPPPPRTQ